MTSTLTVRDATAADIAWAAAWMDVGFGSRRQARLGELVDALAFPAVVAERDGERAGIATFRLDGDGAAELVFIATVDHHDGVGSALLEAVMARLPVTCRRLWLITTNDNVDALRFYQRRGFRLTALHAGAADIARERIKPALPVEGYHGIPLHDELELERLL